MAGGVVGTQMSNLGFEQALARRGVAAESLKANLLFEPWEVKSASNNGGKAPKVR